MTADIEFGTRVIDREGNVLGKVDHVIRDSWSGETSKFMVRRSAPDTDLFLAPADIAEATADTITLKASVTELNNREGS